MAMGLIVVLFVTSLMLTVISNLTFGFQNRVRMRFMAIIGVGSVIVVASHAMVDFSMQIPAVASYFATLIAAVSAICLQRIKKDAISSAPHTKFGGR
jgi:hypothetical protein